MHTAFSRQTPIAGLKEIWSRTVSFARLDRIIDNGRWCAPFLNPADTLCIQKLVWEAMGVPVALSED
jgi:hypothetical protein